MSWKNGTFVSDELELKFASTEKITHFVNRSGTKKCITDFYESVVDTIDEVTAHLETVTSRKNDSIEKHLFSEFLNDIMYKGIRFDPGMLHF